MEIVQQITDGKDKLAEPGELLSKEATELLADFERRSSKLEGLLAAEDAQAPVGRTQSEEPAAGSADLEDLRMENSSLRELHASSEGEMARLRGLLEEHQINTSPPLPAEDRQLAEELGVAEDTYRRMKKSFSGEPEQPAQTPQDQAHKAFITKVDIRAQGWRDIRQKPAFAAFCNTRPGGQFGPSYLEMLKEAAQTFDADTTAMVYNAYKSAPEAPYKPSREAANSRSKGGDGAPVASEVWTPEKIQQFDKDVHTGKIKRGSAAYTRLRASYDAWLSNLTVAG